MLRRVHQRRGEGTGLEFERGAWKSSKVELRRTELGVRLLVAVARVFEKMCGSAFDGRVWRTCEF